MSADLDALVQALEGTKAGNGYVGRCPAHDDQRASLSISKPNGKILLHCHAGCDQAEVIAALQARGLWPESKPKQKAQAVTEYDYVDEHGELVFQVVRFEPKTFRQRRPDGKGGWTWKAGGKVVPFNLPVVLKAIGAGETIYVVEGEKDVLSARKIGITATCNAAGANKWKREHSEFLRGANVVVIPDNDEVGRSHADQVAALLDGVAESVRIVQLPKLQPKGDLTDWITAGGTRAELERLAGLAQPTQAGPAPGILAALQREMRAKEEATQKKFSKPDAIEVVRHLAALSAVEYDQQRDAAAKLLSCRTSTLDQEVERVREQTKAETDPPAAVQDDDAWATAVDGAELLDDLRSLAQRFLILPHDGDNVIALWALFTYTIDVAGVAPILALLSPEKRCGKTTTLELLKRLARRALPASNVTPAALFRSVEKWTPTLLVDEADTFLRDRDELRGIINSGHTRATAFVLRTEGDNHDPVQFSTWCAKAIALIGKLPDTIEDRSIVLTLRRKLRSECLEKLRHADPAEFETLRRKCVRWARDNAHRLRAARPSVPEALNDRAADSWEPLLAIADLAGGRWPELARETACQVSRAGAESDSLRVELLRDIQAMFKRLGVDRIPSELLVDELCKSAETRWADFSRGGKRITQRQLAGLLKLFEIQPRDIRFDSGVKKAYAVDWFQDAFRRYIPAENAQQGNISEESMRYGPFSSATDEHMLRTEKDDKSLNEQECCGVAHKNEGSGQGPATTGQVDGDAEVF